MEKKGEIAKKIRKEDIIKQAPAKVRERLTALQQKIREHQEKKRAEALRKRKEEEQKPKKWYSPIKVLGVLGLSPEQIKERRDVFGLTTKAVSREELKSLETIRIGAFKKKEAYPDIKITPYSWMPPPQEFTLLQSKMEKWETKQETPAGQIVAFASGVGRAVLEVPKFISREPELASVMTIGFAVAPSITIGKIVSGVVSTGFGVVTGYDIKEKIPRVLLHPKGSGARIGGIGEITGQALLSGVMIYSGISELKQAYIGILGRRPIQEVPTKQMIKEVEPFTRKRATLMLKDEKGRYILGETKTGQAISIGGGIPSKRSAKYGLLKELKEETGLTRRDISGLKYKGKVVFPEETFFVYEAVIKDVSKIKPASDITAVRTITRAEAIGTTGMSAKYPVTKGGVRVYELAIINWLETGIKPTWLGITTPKGKYFFGTQSRYDVPYKTQKQYLKGEELRLAHGTQKTPLLRDMPMDFNKKMKVIAEKTQRGGTQGLYLQPPISAGRYPKVIRLVDYTGKGARVSTKQITKLPIKISKQASEGYIGVSYLGIGTGKEVSLGLRIGHKKPTALLLKEPPTKPITTTPKAIAGKEVELIILPDTILKTTRKAEVISLGGKGAYLQPTKIVQDTFISKLITKFKSKDVSVSQKRAIAIELKSLTGIEYGEYTYISPTQIIPKYIIRKEKRKKVTEEYEIKISTEFKPSPHKTYKEVYEPTPYKEPSKPYRKKEVYEPEKPTYKPEPYKEPYVTPPYKEPYREPYKEREGDLIFHRKIHSGMKDDVDPREFKLLDLGFMGRKRYAPSLYAQTFDIYATRKEIGDPFKSVYALSVRPIPIGKQKVFEKVIKGTGVLVSRKEKTRLRSKPKKKKDLV